MAIDPSIALSFRPPQIAVANPLEQMGQMLSLKNLMTQGQMRDLQFKQAQMEYQGRQNLAKLISGMDTPQADVLAPPASPGPMPGQYDEPQLMGPAGGPSAATPAPGPALPLGAVPPAAAAPAAPRAFPTLGQILKADPINGMAFAKGYHETHKAETESQIKELEAGQKMWEARGSAAQSVLDAPDPKAAFAPAIWDLVKRGAMTDTEARQTLDRGFNADELKRFASMAQDVKTQAETKLTDLKSLGEGWANAEKSLKGVHDQAGYDRLFPTFHPAVQQVLGPTYDSKMKTALGVPLTEQPKLFRDQALSNGMLVAQALRESPEAAQAVIAGFDDPQQRQLFQGVKTPLEAQQRSLDPEKYITTERTVRKEAFDQAANLREGFTKASERFMEVRDAYSRIHAAASGPPGGIADIGLVNGYMKLVDPGSIVREGQAATVENAAGVPDTIRNLWNKMIHGERLPEETRKQLLAHVEQIYGNAAKDHQALESDYTERAKRFQLDPKDVIVPLGSTAATPPAATDKPAADQSSARSAPLTPGYVQQGKDGQWHMYMGGDRFDQKNWQAVKKSGNDWIAR